jgi:glycosyltransferase involved in cell wall biosynthesis
VTITVSMPYLHASCKDYIAAAVTSVLDQSHADLTLIVVNDGASPDSAWVPLEHVFDSRLIRFDLPDNRGRYFADAVTLAASPHEWWTPHDADDTSGPDRFAALLAAAEPSTELVLSGYTAISVTGKVTPRPPVTPRAQRVGRGGRLAHVGHHTCLWAAASLRDIGGPHPEWRIAYDTLMLGLGVRHLEWTPCADVAYYWSHGRSTQLTGAPDTGMQSALRRQLWRRRERLWRACQDPAKISTALAPSPGVAREVAYHADRLRELL